MSRPITLFTGQWADLPLDTVAQKASTWSFDSLKLARRDLRRWLSHGRHLRRDPGICQQQETG